MEINMPLFRLRSKAHPATITFDKSIIKKERLVARVKNIKNALESNEKRKVKYSRDKKAKLLNEIRSILVELDAREETIRKIESTFEE
jgi:septal ring factor EnvC (AmiA/AmiB activator)